MPGYTSIDPVITRWAKAHKLSLFTECAGDEIRVAYLSSEAGECFLIAVDPPLNGRVGIHVRYVEGPRDIDEEPAQDWSAIVSDFSAVLEEALHTVLKWMEPSKRYFPNIGGDGAK